MKKLRNIMLICVSLVGIILIGLGLVFKIYSSPVGEDEKVEVVIDSGTSSSKIGEILKEKDLIRDTTFFKIYLKLFNVDDLKAGKYELNKNMSLEEIVNLLKEGNNYNENEISLIFREGINMRKVASIIAANTNNTEDDVYSLLNNKEYLQSLIDEYWFITDDILDSKLYYSLEGYLFPDTYRFMSKDVKVDEIFNKLIKKMDSVLTPYKDKIEKSKFSVHELLTLASMAELESRDVKDYRLNVVSVFVNRLNKKMSLGSDVTTRYSLKIDDAKKVLTKSQYNTANAYNTRSESLAGKLPSGPIGMVSESSIKASIEYPETEYLYFIANINTGETFFYKDYNDFLKKKNELSSVNGGL